MGTFNKQNRRSWDTQLPNTVSESLQSTQSLIVWCNLSKSKSLWIYCFDEGTVTGTGLESILRYYLFLKVTPYSSDMIP